MLALGILIICIVSHIKYIIKGRIINTYVENNFIESYLAEILFCYLFLKLYTQIFFFFSKPQLHGITSLNILFIYFNLVLAVLGLHFMWRLSLVACESGLCSVAKWYMGFSIIRHSLQGMQAQAVAARKPRDGLCVPSIFRQIQPLDHQENSKHF